MVVCNEHQTALFGVDVPPDGCVLCTVFKRIEELTDQLDEAKHGKQGTDTKGLRYTSLDSIQETLLLDINRIGVRAVQRNDVG